MDFPNFENDDVQDVQVEPIIVQESGNNYNPFPDMGGEQYHWNIPVAESVVGGANVTSSDPFASYQQSAVDEEEENRQRQRKAEEDERRSKLMHRMNEEIRVKQENRDKARNHLEDWSQ
jgi:hypothetical protein